MICIFKSNNLDGIPLLKMPQEGTLAAWKTTKKGVAAAVVPESCIDGTKIDLDLQYKVGKERVDM